jgi:hypothetical protein
MLRVGVALRDFTHTLLMCPQAFFTILSTYPLRWLAKAHTDQRADLFLGKVEGALHYAHLVLPRTNWRVSGRACLHVHWKA